MPSNEKKNERFSAKYRSAFERLAIGWRSKSTILNDSEREWILQEALVRRWRYARGTDGSKNGGKQGYMENEGERGLFQKISLAKKKM